MIFDVVLKVLTKADLQGLIRMGAPEDEYESEAKLIAIELIGGADISAELIRRVWEKQFCSGMAEGVRWSKHCAMRPEFETVAQSIREGLAE